MTTRASTIPKRKQSRAAAATREPARLVIAVSEASADMLYGSRFLAPDPFLLLVQNGRSTILLSDLEVDRGRRQAGVDEVLSLSVYAGENKEALGREPAFARVAAHFLKSRRVRRAVVPADFPLGLSRELAREGVEVAPPKAGLFWPQRLHKTPAELAKLRRALEITQIGMTRGLEVLRAAKIAGGKKGGAHGELTWGGSVLTSERLRAEIDTAILHQGGAPANTIVAGGEQACDPHERGSGPLRAGELIILDIFPRDTATGYYGDLTRTVVKGRASDAQRALWQTVQEGQRMAIEGTKAGADGKKLHEAVQNFFTQRGFPTEMREGRHVGFFHGTGHGLGLDLHEEPRFQRTRRFEAGMVFTIEPGLYYPGLGGVRIEDVVAVTRNGRELLSNLEQRLEV
jgi:Xaa-Pro aminopeptidase